MKIYENGVVLTITAHNITLGRWGVFNSEHHRSKSTGEEKESRIGHYSNWDSVVKSARQNNLSEDQVKFIESVQYIIEGKGRVPNVRVKEIEAVGGFSGEKVETKSFILSMYRGQLCVYLRKLDPEASNLAKIGYFVFLKRAFTNMATFTLCKSTASNEKVTMEQLESHCESVFEEFKFMPDML